MSTVYLSSVQSASKLDSYTGLPLPSEDDLPASGSVPLLLDSSSRKNSPLLDKVLRGRGPPGGSVSSSQELGELRGEGEEGEGEREEEGEGKASSFVDILESRDPERDQAWMETQVHIEIAS